MKKNQTIFFSVLSLGIGLIVGYSINRFISYDKEYFELEYDYSDEKLGLIKKGSLLQYDQTYSEGFTRYILYLNIHDSQSPVKNKNSKDVIPYWIKKDTLQ